MFRFTVLNHLEYVYYVYYTVNVLFVVALNILIDFSIAHFFNMNLFKFIQNRAVCYSYRTSDWKSVSVHLKNIYNVSSPQQLSTFFYTLLKCDPISVAMLNYEANAIVMWS